MECIMKIQSLSVCVPGGCPNNCKFCVSRIHPNKDYSNVWKNYKSYKRFEREFYDRLSYCRQHGCTDLILTGDGEPSMNIEFLKMFDKINRQLNTSFKKIEIQTAGVGIDNDKFEFLNEIGIKTIALSISSLDDELNGEINQTSEKYTYVVIKKFIARALEYNFNIRLCFNLSSYFEPFFSNLNDLFNVLIEMNINQVTFRKLYTSQLNTVQDKWIKKYQFNPDILVKIRNYIKLNGRKLEVLPFGAQKYSVNGISTIVDDDCMSTASHKEELKYAILRTNCKLYSKWDDKGSLIF